MPFVHIEMLEGRTHEQKVALVDEVTQVVSKHTGAPKENIYVILTDLKKGEQLAQGGKFK